MASNLSYQRLQQEIWFGEEVVFEDIRQKVIRRLRNSSRFRRVHIRKKLKVKIPSLKRFLNIKAKVLKCAWIKVYKRLKESQSHFGDLFAGNYLFMQVTPTPLKSSTTSYTENGKSFVVNHNNNNNFKDRDHVRAF